MSAKAMAHPTDSHLLLLAIEWMNQADRKAGIVLRQGIVTETLTAAGSDDTVGNDTDLLRPPPVPT